eukprot:CAMPEP_0172495850 /NCGR_PEP_ID=MMETSP1066-20121228/78913_1 /TAXON_ID=671091 /ORGANISM="Coscinodiscus wailesii, Strain CCMP2513" /LENGTH=81 /DNA_ID=CAMNT_0013267823 /DNA_START=132 /DNA_END=377 /DNA_ORIENTATION=+
MSEDNGAAAATGQSSGTLVSQHNPSEPPNPSSGGGGYVPRSASSQIPRDDPMGRDEPGTREPVAHRHFYNCFYDDFDYKAA